MAGNVRRRILVLLRLFDEKTDEQHTLTMPEIITELERNGITADRRAVYEDIEELTNMGWDIVRELTGKRGYFLAYRLFEDPEINIIADSLRSSRFLSEQKTTRMLSKLEKLASPGFRKRLSYRTFITSRPKGDNSNVLYLVDTLSQAISDAKGISFYYYLLNHQRRREYLNDGQTYIVYPETLLWHGDSYYLIAATQDWDHKHFRVDRMSDIQIIDSMNRGNTTYNSGELKNYIRSTFGPEAGKPIPITLLCEKDCSEEIFDRFGMGAAIYAVSDTHFKVDISAAPGIQFYAWVFSQNGKVQILSPKFIRKQMREHLCMRLSEYNQ